MWQNYTQAGQMDDSELLAEELQYRLSLRNLASAQGESAEVLRIDRQIDLIFVALEACIRGTRRSNVH